MTEWKGYIPDVLSKEDLEAYRLDGYGGRVGFGERPCVLVIDMNYTGKEANHKTGYEKAAIAGIKRLLEVARRVGVPVVYMTATPRRSAADLGMWLYKHGAIREEYEFVKSQARPVTPELAPQEGDILCPKAGRPSAFFGTLLESLLKFHQIDTIIATGVSTSGCVRSSVVDAFSYSYRVILPLECVADRSPLSQKVSLFEMDQKYADVMPLDLVIQHLEGMRKTTIVEQRVTA